MYSFGYFPGVWLLYADVSEHSICSIFIGWMWSTSCRRFGRLYLFHLHRLDMKYFMTTFRKTVSSIFIGWIWSTSCRRFGRLYLFHLHRLDMKYFMPTFRKTLSVPSS
jgi:hypothetical protein